MLKHIIAAALLATLGLAGEARADAFYVKAEGSLCVDIKGGQLKEGTPIQLWPCHGKAPQNFNIETTMGLVFAMAKQELCVDGRDRQPLRLVNCERVHTQWRYDARTSTVRSANGLCWDILQMKIQQQQPLVAWKCHNGRNQQFVFNK